MNCKELVHLLEDYMDGTMEEHLRHELSVHIEACEPCLNFLRTYEKTRVLCRHIRPDEIPDELRKRLKSFIMEKVRERQREIEKYMGQEARERLRQVKALLQAYAADRLSPVVADLFQAHKDRCERCGAFLRSINGGKGPVEISGIPPDVEEHFAEFLDALPPGEAPTLS